MLLCTGQFQLWGVALLRGMCFWKGERDEVDRKEDGRGRGQEATNRKAEHSGQGKGPRPGAAGQRGDRLCRLDWLVSFHDRCLETN